MTSTKKVSPKGKTGRTGTSRTRAKPKRSRYTNKAIIEALRASHGIQAVAAKALGCSRSTIQRRIEESAAIREAYEEAREVVLDEAEHTLFEAAIKNKDTASLIYLLRTIGRRRGYGDKAEVEVTATVDLADIMRQIEDLDADDLAQRYRDATGGSGRRNPAPAASSGRHR